MNSAPSLVTPLVAAYEHNGKAVSAEAFYAIACDPRRSVAVEACAGAGKTWMLVSRMVRALLEGGPGGAVQPHEILAITFTKKAAGEMRERLYEWLAEFANADDETLQRELKNRGVEGQSSLQANQAMGKQLSNLYQQMLAHGRPVQIKTFHGWFAALLRSAPMAVLQQMGLPASYELLEDDGPAKALVWRRFYAALLKQPELKADFEAVVLAHGRFQTGIALQGALDKRTEFLLADAAGVVDSSVKHFGVVFGDLSPYDRPEDALASEVCRQRWLQRAQTLAADKNKTPQRAAQLVVEAFEKPVLTERLALLRKAFFVADDNRLTNHLLKFDAAKQAEPELQLLCAAVAQHEAWDYQQRMTRLSRLLLAEFAALKRERGWVDMNDVECAAQVMLGDPVLSGWVQERLDARIRHLMIDEFQDTNPLQWQALSSWLSGYAGAGGRTPSVFIVGDPKQSIYRFRRAEPQVFIAAQAFVRETLKGELLACDHTRRSSQAVVGAVNAVMGQAAANDGYEGFRIHTSASHDEGRVLRLPAIPRAEKSQAPGPLEWRDSLTTPRELPEETLRTLEARQAASWIASQLNSQMAPTLFASHDAQPREEADFVLGGGGDKTSKPSDIMVLCRKRASLLPLLDELRALHIPAQIGEKTELIDCCEVLDIVALLDVLVSPQHDLSLARALRSPLFNLSDEGLVQIVLAKADSKLSWFEVLQKDELLVDELIDLGATLMRYKALLDALPPHDALQAIYDRGDVLARFAAAAPAASRGAVLSNLRALLAAALQVDGGRYATPYAFVRALKAGGLQAPAAVNPDAVRLLTIHGAKGLEAKAVLLLDTDTAPRNADSMSVLVDWPGQALAPQKFVFLISESTPPACATDALAQEQAARRREELNALYVAITRAKNTLVVSSIESYRQAPDSWWQRLHGLADAETLPVQVVANEQMASGRFSLPELPSFVISNSPAPEQVIEIDSVTARIGKAMHRLLEFSDLSEPAVRRVALEFGLNTEQASQAQTMAHSIRYGAAAWAWDPSVVQWQGNEVELTHQGDTFRLDRLVQRRDASDAGINGQWWVLDYKSAYSPQRQPNLVAKMKTYIAAVQAIYPDETVKAAFLTGDGQVVMVD